MENKLITIQRLAQYFLPVMLFMPYIAMIFPAYVVVLLFLLIAIGYGQAKCTVTDWTFLLLVVIFCTFKIVQVGPATGESLIRYYFGLILIYFFIKWYDLNLDISKLILIFFCVTFFEAVIANIIDPFQYLPNYPKSVFEFGTASHYTKFMGFYQRPYGMGSNASASSTLIVALLAFKRSIISTNDKRKDTILELLGGFTVILFASGVGLSLYFFYLCYRFKLFNTRNLVFLGLLVFLLITYYTLLFSFFSSDSILQKVSGAYIDFLYDYKIGQITDVYKTLTSHGNSFYIGENFVDKSLIIIQSDFAWNDFFECMGICGLVLFVLFVCFKINFSNLMVLSVLLLGAFHYAGMFSLPGQVIGGYALYYFNIKNSEQKMSVI